MLRITFLLVLVIIFVQGDPDDVVVDTKYGKISGLVAESIIPNEKYFSFLSIPYAVPPVGELRYTKATPHPGWEGVLDCKEEKSACAQAFIPSRVADNYGYYGSEDCLHLSIHTPKLPSTNGNPKLPVIFFTLNDQFRMSFNLTKDYKPDFFIHEDVIIVTVKHRLGSLGFLSYEDDVQPGNNGIKDIILALQWVQDNIHNFGGDSQKVTLMGSQGGAVTADMLLHSKKAKGLFSKVIMQSGTSWNSLYFNSKGRIRAKELAKDLDLIESPVTALLRALRKEEPADIINAEFHCVKSDEPRTAQRGIYPFGPVLEHDHPDAVVIKTSDEALNESPIDIPVMIGYNSRESLDYLDKVLKSPHHIAYANRDFMFMFPIAVDYRFKINDNVYEKALKEIKDFYFETGSIDVKKPGEFFTYINDLLQFYALDFTVRNYVNSTKSSVYYYTFDYSGDWNIRKQENLKNAMNLDGTWGASLTDELCYLFMCSKFEKSYSKALKESDSEELTVLQNMVKLWTNFAKYGNPTPQGSSIVWPPATPEKKECLVINEGLEVKTNIHQDRIDFWDNFLEKYRSMAVNGVVKDIRDEL